MANAHLETVGSKADSIHLAIKNVPTSNFYWGYLRALEIVAPADGLIDRSIKLVLFDRGFYSKVLMLTLSKTGYPYLPDLRSQE